MPAPSTPRSTVSVSTVIHPRYSHVVTYPDGGKRRKRYFIGAGKARTFAKLKETEIRNLGMATRGLSDEECRVLGEYRRKLASHGKSLRQALEFYCSHLDQIESSAPIHEIRDRLIRRVRDEKRSRRHIDDLESRLRPFVQDFGDQMAASISSNEISRWLGSLGLSPATVTNYRRVLHNLFTEAVKAGACATNPVAQAIRPKVVEEEVGILTPGQSEKLLECADSEILAAIAVGLFAGLRRSEIEQLDWSDINLDRGYITVRGRIAKSARRRWSRDQPTPRLSPGAGRVSHPG